jgi:uncharacterized protein
MSAYIKRSMWLAITLFGWLLLVIPIQAASFDCAKASSKVEKMICADADLSKLDEEMAAAYKEALQDQSKAEATKQAQTQWLKGRNACADAGCVRSSYITRLTDLKSYEGEIEKKLSAVSQTKESAGAFCAEIKRMMHTVVSKIKGAYQTVNVFELEKYYLAGEGTPVEIYRDLDIDGDGVSDLVESGCSASTVEPSDPCLLTARLSSRKKIDFEGWDIRLMKYRSKIYVIAHHDNEARNRLFTVSPNRGKGVIYHPEVAATIKYELYELNGSGATLICKKL